MNVQSQTFRLPPPEAPIYPTTLLPSNNTAAVVETVARSNLADGTLIPKSTDDFTMGLFCAGFENWSSNNQFIRDGQIALMSSQAAPLLSGALNVESPNSQTKAIASTNTLLDFCPVETFAPAWQREVSTAKHSPPRKRIGIPKVRNSTKKSTSSSKQAANLANVIIPSALSNEPFVNPYQLSSHIGDSSTYLSSYLPATDGFASFDPYGSTIITPYADDPLAHLALDQPPFLAENGLPFDDLVFAQRLVEATNQITLPNKTPPLPPFNNPATEHSGLDNLALIDNLAPIDDYIIDDSIFDDSIFDMYLQNPFDSTLESALCDTLGTVPSI